MNAVVFDDGYLTICAEGNAVRNVCRGCQTAIIVIFLSKDSVKRMNVKIRVILRPQNSLISIGCDGDAIIFDSR